MSDEWVVPSSLSSSSSSSWSSSLSAFSSSSSSSSLSIGITAAAVDAVKDAGITEKDDGEISNYLELIKRIVRKKKFVNISNSDEIGCVPVILRRVRVKTKRPT